MMQLVDVVGVVRYTALRRYLFTASHAALTFNYVLRRVLKLIKLRKEYGIKHGCKHAKQGLSHDLPAPYHELSSSHLPPAATI
jgi:hypothetical protein